MARTKLFGLTAAALLLAGCAEDAGVGSNTIFLDNLVASMSTTELAACNAAAEEVAKKADWSKMTTVNVNIRHGIFSPSLLDMNANQPYRIRFTNGDDEAHSFRARDFFRNSAVRGFKFGEAPANGSCATFITVGGSSTAEVELLPTRAGTYPWVNNSSFGGVTWFDGDGFGVINVR